MKWITLWKKLGKQPIKNTQHSDVYALLRNPKTHEYEKVRLLLKFDTYGKPYFVQDFQEPKQPKQKQPQKRK